MAGYGATTFVLNVRSGVLHKIPSFESCNVDAIPERYRQRETDVTQLRARAEYRRPCKRCFR
jgi:hypothetical protein